MDDFWAEGSPDVAVRDNRLCVRTTDTRDEQKHFISSVFLRRIFEGNLLVEFQGSSVADWSHRNFNFFIHTMLCDGRDLYETRGERTGDYPEYHVMDNYLFTCLKSDQQNSDGSDMFRYRMRRDPGFVLMKEVHGYRCENHRWYTFKFLVHAGRISLCIDDLDYETYTWIDPQPLTRGYLGFRTYMSDLQFKDLKIYQLA
jgi:hypothetical protein